MNFSKINNIILTISAVTDNNLFPIYIKFINELIEIKKGKVYIKKKDIGYASKFFNVKSTDFKNLTNDFPKIDLFDDNLSKILLTSFGNFEKDITQTEQAASIMLTVAAEYFNDEISKYEALHNLQSDDAFTLMTYLSLVPLSKTNLPILITGETGIGRESLGRAINSLSGNNGPLIKFDCAAFGPDLTDFLLFGSYMMEEDEDEQEDVSYAELPAILKADGGTLMLRNSESLSIDVQLRLLRCFESQALLSPFGDVLENTAFRLILIANRPDINYLQAALTQAQISEDEEGEYTSSEDLVSLMNEYDMFHPDFATGLCSVHLHLLPLRERREIWINLINYFIDKNFPNYELKGIEPMAERFFDVYPWPGNLREFRLVVNEILTLAKDGIIEVQHLPSRILSFNPSALII